MPNPPVHRREFIATAAAGLLGNGIVRLGAASPGTTSDPDELPANRRVPTAASQSGGAFEWTRTYGGSEEAAAWAVSRTSTGQYLVAGRRGEDGYVVRTDAQGRQIDSWTFPDLELIASIEAEGSDAYLAVGGGSGTGWVLREPLGDSIDDRPGSQWRRRTDTLVLRGVFPTADGPVVTGFDVNSGGMFAFDWEGNRRFGARLPYNPYSLAPAHDGGFVIATGLPGVLLKTDASGAVDWDQQYGDSTTINDIIAVDGGYALAGATEFKMGSFRPIAGKPALIRTDSDGVEQWRTSFDQDRPFAALGLVQVGSQFVIVGGYATDERNPQVQDAFVGGVSEGGQRTDAVTTENGLTYGFNIDRASDGGVVIAGKTEAYGATSRDALLAKPAGFEPEFELSLEKTGCRPLVPGGVAEFDVVPQNNGDQPVEVALTVRTDDLPGDWSPVRTGGKWAGSPPSRTLSVTPDDEYVIFPRLLRLRVPSTVDGTMTVTAEASRNGSELATASTTLPVRGDGFDPTLHGFGFENFGPDGPGHDHGKISTEEVLRIVGSDWDFSDLPIPDPGASVKAAVALAIYAILEQFTDGHCYGMCLLADEYFAGGVDTDVAGDVEAAIDIQSPADPLGSVIDERQQRQSFDFGTFLGLQSLSSSAPLDYQSVLDKITTAIDDRGTAPVGIGQSDSRVGHQLLAYCYESRENRTDVYVYDPNYSFAADDPATSYVRAEKSPGDPAQGYRRLTFYTDDEVEFAGYDLNQNTTYDRAVYLPPRPDYDVAAVILAQVTAGVIEFLAELFETAGDLIGEGVTAASDLAGLAVFGVKSPADLTVVGPDGEELPAAPDELVDGSEYEQVRVGYDIDPTASTIHLEGTDDGSFTVDAVGADADGNVVTTDYTDEITRGEQLELAVDTASDGTGEIGPPSTIQDGSESAAGSDTDGDTDGSDDGGLPDWAPLAGIGAGGIAAGAALFRYLSDSADDDQ